MTGKSGDARQPYLGRGHLHWPGGVGIKAGFLEDVKIKGALRSLEGNGILGKGSCWTLVSLQTLAHGFLSNFLCARPQTRLFP